MRSKRIQIDRDRAVNFFEKGLLPKNLTPMQWGGEASGEKDFVFFKEQLKIRAQNEKNFKL